MGRRGPAKTPTNILKLRGSWRGKSRGDEPVPPPLPAECPAWLTPMAKERWLVLHQQLSALGILGETDANGLARYCTIWALWREAEQFIAEHGMTYEGQSGPKLHPKATLALKYSEQLVKLESQFGMTPAARAQLKVNPAPVFSAKSKFFPEPNEFFPNESR